MTRAQSLGAALALAAAGLLGRRGDVVVRDTPRRAEREQIIRSPAGRTPPRGNDGTRISDFMSSVGDAWGPSVSIERPAHTYRCARRAAAKAKYQAARNEARKGVA